MSDAMLIIIVRACCLLKIHMKHQDGTSSAAVKSVSRRHVSSSLEKCHFLRLAPPSSPSALPSPDDARSTEEGLSLIHI